VSPQRCLLCFAILLAAALCPIGAHAGGRNSATFDGQVDFGAQLFRSGDGCLYVDGAVSSGTFFEDLKRIDLGDRFEYRKHGKVVTQYPDSLTTSIQIMGSHCDSGEKPPSFSIFDSDTYSLRLVAEWKDGMSLRPAKLSPTADCVATKMLTGPDLDSALPTLTCKMTVNATGVPLGDHLIVSVFAPSGERITRLSAAP
jgi:hypothetical protein